MSYNSPEEPTVDTATNMFVSILANSDRLVPHKDVVHYDDDVKKYEEEKLESCMDEESPKYRPEPQEQNREQQTQLSEQPNQTENASNNDSPKNQKDDLDEYDTATPIRKKLLKLDMIRKLTELVNKGVHLSQDYNMDSDYKLMKYEYELHSGIIAKHNMVSFINSGCISSVGILETLNTSYNPFGLQLNGWSTKVNSKSDQLYDAISDMYEKWVGPGGQVPPELRLIGILGFSAASVHFQNVSVNKMPNLNERLTDDPNYLENIRRQAIGSTLQNETPKKEFVEKREKEYQNILQQAKDYQQYRKYEDEYNQTVAQQTAMKPPSLPKSITQQTEQRQPTMQQPLQYMMPSNPSQFVNGLTPEDFSKFREKEIEIHRQQMLRDQQNKKSKKESIETLDEVSHQSMDSIIERNQEMENIIKDAEVASNISASKTCKRRNKKNKTLKLDI